MKGVALFSDMFMLFAMIGISIFLVTLIYWFWIVHGVEQATGLTGPRIVELNLFERPVKYDAALLAFLETTKEIDGQNVPMKDLVVLAAAQNTSTVWTRGEFIDLKIESQVLSRIIEEPYILKTADVVISSSGSPITFSKISAFLFSLEGEPIELQLLVGS